MKKWYVGVDGGGTKTAFAVSAQDGVPVVTMKKSGCSYQAVGVEEAIKIIVEGIRACLKEAGASPEDCAGCCLGVPCFGEDPEIDRTIAAALAEQLAPIPIRVVNDVEVGWAGALKCQPGIHIVAGTGAIAFCKSDDGRSARCGGWNEFFGDEGSCYWIGREAMSLFSKEADGRIPRGALYEIVRQDLGLNQDVDFIGCVVKDIAPRRDMVAAFQLYASQAAKAGDAAALALYDRAAGELAMMAGALRRELSLPENVPVTYSGGLFQNGELILKPLEREVSACGCRLQDPAQSALEGALLLAVRHFLIKEAF